MRYIVCMQSKSTSVRVEELAKERLKAIGRKSGVSVTKLITLATYLYAEHVQRTGTINIPINAVVAESGPEWDVPDKKKKKTVKS